MNDVAPIGHNLKTLLTGQELTDYLNLTYGEIIERAAELLLKAPEFLVIETDAQDEAATEFMVKLRACWKAAENARTAEKTPYDDAAGIVHAFFKKPILDPLGLAPDNKLPFDPMARDDLGFGPRISMAQTLFKVAKERAERKKREDEAARLRKIEDDARAARLAEEKRIRDAEDARLKELRDKEAAEAEERRQAELAASRKRTEENRKLAEVEAATRREQEDRARLIREDAEKKIAEEREQRDQTQRAEENRLAEQRSSAEVAAAAPAADLTRARGNLGGVSSLRTFVSFRDIDRSKLDLEMLRPYFKDKAFEEAITGYIGANKATVNSHCKAGTQPIKGVIIYEGHKSAGRA